MLWISVLQWEKKQGTRYAFNHLSHFFHPCIDTIHKAEAEKGRSFVHFSLCSTNAHCCILTRSVQPILWKSFTKNNPHVFCARDRLVVVHSIIVVNKVSTNSIFFFERVGKWGNSCYLRGINAVNHASTLFQPFENPGFSRSQTELHIMRGPRAFTFKLNVHLLAVTFWWKVDFCDSSTVNSLRLLYFGTLIF